MNRQTFDITKPNARKQFQQLLDSLLDYNSDNNNDDFNDIHIKQEESFFVIEWEKIPFNHEWGGEFKYIDYDEVIMKDVCFPDGHYEYLFPEDVETTLKTWKEQHPEWEKNEFGIWTNVEENRQCTIEWHIDDWCKHEPKENDSTFAEGQSNCNGSSFSLEHILTHDIPKDVLYRTQYIIISPDIAKRIGQTKFNYIIKMNDIDIDFDYVTFGNKTETVARHFYVYTKEDWPNEKTEILFLTNNNYLIYKQNLNIN